MGELILLKQPIPPTLPTVEERIESLKDGDIWFLFHSKNKFVVVIKIRSGRYRLSEWVPIKSERNREGQNEVTTIFFSKKRIIKFLKGIQYIWEKK